MNSEHSDGPARNWRERWIEISDEGDGGQSDTKRVRSKDGDQHDRFLKVLLHQNDSVRRKRMFREVASYRTLDHASIPKMVDTNVEKYEDTSYKLYLVTELIEGANLERLIKERPFNANVGIRLVIRLLNIVEFCHENDTVHRDIKADNIILKDCDPNQPFLIDFGLSFNKKDPPQNGTSSEDELGNRFCRFPELSVSSHAKRDPRSDVTFCAGILLYVLTAKIPALLMDEEGKMPHQRDVIRKVLEASVSPDMYQRLLLIFDRSFQTHLSLRWQSASDLGRELRTLVDAPADNEIDIERLRKRVHNYKAQPHIQVATDVNGKIQ